MLQQWNFPELYYDKLHNSCDQNCQEKQIPKSIKYVTGINAFHSQFVGSTKTEKQVHN